LGSLEESGDHSEGPEMESESHIRAISLGLGSAFEEQWTVIERFLSIENS
jgi:hypothetical protein